MNLTPSQETRAAWSDEAFRRFWKRMADVFGLRWYEQNGPEPTASWKNGLSQFPPALVMQALIGYETTTHSGYPPNLPQFLEEVRAARRRAVPADKALPAPKRSPDQIEKNLTGLRRVRDYAARIAERFKREPVKSPVPNDDHFERK